MQPTGRSGATGLRVTPQGWACGRAVSRADLLPLLSVAVAYGATAVIGLTYAAVGSTVTLIWAPSGIALAALLLLGLRMAPAVALGALAANAWTGVPLAVAAGIAAGNTLEALAAAWLLTHVGDFRAALDRRRDVMALVAVAALGSTTLSASVGVLSLSLGQLLAPGVAPHAWVKWWLGDMMGVLVVAPAVLVWVRQPIPSLPAARAAEAAVLASALVLVSYMVFGAPEVAGRGYYPAALAIFPFVIWAALSFGQLGASLLSVVVAVVAVWGTILGTGPFVVDHAFDALARWCVFSIVVAVTGLLLAASVMEQRRAQSELMTSHAELERQVQARTRALLDANAELRHEMAERRKLESEIVRLGEAQQQAIGRELHDGLGQHLTSVALLAASLQQRLSSSASPEAAAAARIVELANEAGALTRSLSHGLYPVAFEFGGLLAALERLAEHTQVPDGMRCHFHGDPGAQVHDSAVALNLYRIAQEAVHNAVKYSRAQRVLIELGWSGTQHRLCISDDGVGFRPDLGAHQEGLGLHSMRYRARLLGCRLSIEAPPSGGTRVVVTTPDLGSST